MAIYIKEISKHELIEHLWTLVGKAVMSGDYYLLSADDQGKFLERMHYFRRKIENNDLCSFQFLNEVVTGELEALAE